MSGPDVRRYLAAPFETMIAVATLATGIVLIFDPHALKDAAIGAGTQSILYLWESLYMLGAIGILAGLTSHRIRVEIAGLLIFMAAIITNAVAIVDVAGIRGLNSALTFTAIAVGCAGRCYALINLWDRHERKPGD